MVIIYGRGVLLGRGSEAGCEISCWGEGRIAELGMKEDRNEMGHKESKVVAQLNKF